MRFSAFLPVSGPFASKEGIRTVAGHAEELGYDGVAIHDHVSWDEGDKYHFLAGSAEAVDEKEQSGGRVIDFYESVVTLSYLAGATDDLDLVTAAAVLSWRDPVMLAKQCATLSELSGNRLILGGCIGNVGSDFEALDVPFQRRGALTEETLEIVSTIVEEGELDSYDGEYTDVRNGSFYPRAEDLPIWYAGESDPALRRTAKYADGWLPLGPPSFFEDRLPELHTLMEAEGRDPDSLDVGVLLKVAIAETDEAAEEKAEYTIDQQIDLEELERHPELAEIYVTGSPERVVEQLEEYASVGVEYPQIGFISHSRGMLLDDMALFADEVMPHLRSS